MQENKLLGFELDEKGLRPENYQITDALKKNNSTYWEYFYNAYTFDNLFCAFVPVSHYRNNFTYHFSKNRLITGEWMNIVYNTPYGEYRRKGYITNEEYNGDTIDKTIVEYDKSILTVDTDLCDESLKFFEKTVELCEENNCQLILITYPQVDNSISVNRIQECNDFNTELASKYGLEYLNMMICKEYTMVKDDAYDFSDTGHMNDSGARKYTYYVCKELLKIINKENYKDDFYSSADEWAYHRRLLIEY